MFTNLILMLKIVMVIAVHYAAEVGATDVLDYLAQVCGCDLSVVE